MTEDQARQRVIASMCPDRVCRICGEPSRRVVESERFWLDSGELITQRILPNAGVVDPGGTGIIRNDGKGRRVLAESFTDCGHDDWRPGVWLDPFADAGEK